MLLVGLLRICCWPEFTNTEKGLFDLMATISFLGPLVAYAFIDKTSLGWRGAYIYMTVFHACALVFLFLVYHPPSFETIHRSDSKTKLQLLRELDFGGLFLFSAGCVLFLLGVNWGGRQHPWKSGYVIAPMVLGVICLVGLGFWEVYVEIKYPFMPPRLFKNWRRYTDLQFCLEISLQTLKDSQWCSLSASSAECCTMP